MSHWWRAHDEAIDDPKLQLLPPPIFKAWFNLMCLASANDGYLPPISTLAFKLHLSTDKAKHVVAELAARGLLDDCDGRFRPHNWDGRQFKSDVTDPTNAERQKRYRERHAVTENVTPKSVTVTLTREQITETDSETSSLRSEDACARERAGFDEFWKAYPHKVGRKAAYKAFVIVMKSGSVAIERLLFSLTAYVNKTDDRPWCNPATWLNQGRWDDQPAPEVRSGNANSLLAAIGRQREKLGPSTVDYEPQLDPVLSLPSR